MPTLATMKIPPTTDWNEFEIITQSAIKIKWNSPNLQRNGRQGQPQCGVDIFGEDFLGRFSGIQCKNINDNLDLDYVKREVKKSEKFKPSLSNFFIATTLPNDSFLQQQVRIFSLDRIKKGKFPVGIFFWEDIIQDLVKNEMEFQKHYPNINLKYKQADIEATELLCIIDLVYIGGTLEYKVELIFGEIGQMAHEDPLGIRFFGNMLKSCSSILMASESSVNFIKNVDDMINLCLTVPETEKDNKLRWQNVDDLITKIQQDVPLLRYKYSGRKLAAYQLGVKLSIWELATNDDRRPLKKEIINSIKKYLGMLKAPTKLIRDVEKLFNEYNRSKSISVVQIPNNVYHKIRNFLIDLELEQ